MRATRYVNINEYSILTPAIDSRQFRCVQCFFGDWLRLVVLSLTQQAVRGCRAIIVFNHCSYTDAVVMTSYFAPSGVAKVRLVLCAVAEVKTPNPFRHVAYENRLSAVIP